MMLITGAIGKLGSIVLQLLHRQGELLRFGKR